MRIRFNIVTCGDSTVRASLNDSDYFDIKTVPDYNFADAMVCTLRASSSKEELLSHLVSFNVPRHIVKWIAEELPVPGPPTAEDLRSANNDALRFLTRVVNFFEETPSGMNGTTVFNGQKTFHIGEGSLIYNYILAAKDRLEKG